MAWSSESRIAFRKTIETASLVTTDALHCYVAATQHLGVHMTIEFECPDCSRECRVKDTLAGRGVTCKDCGTKINVPNPDAEDDRWDDYDEEPVPGPGRRRPRKSSGGSKKKKKAAESSGAVWKKIMGPLAMLLGVIIAGFSLTSLLDGNGRAVRGIITGCVFAGVGFKWLRDG